MMTTTTVTTTRTWTAAISDYAVPAIDDDCYAAARKGGSRFGWGM
jgi:hypothetical protein